MARNVEMLHPRLMVKAVKFAVAMARAGLPFVITCTGRTLDEQAALYAQGRQELRAVNALRKKAGLPPITHNENQRKVTWTMASRHLLDKSGHARAFDIALLTTRQGRAHWDITADIDDNDIPDYRQAGEIGKSVGLTWGGDWKKPDYPHFELPEGEI
ncbi:MAG: M15 family metallopeptidase [Salinivirgaceae bacterium]|nr:M15 family metallopeptidase [Salinivirgaceae bacterium]